MHHLTHIGAKGRGVKAGDHLTVPLCLTHHTDLHARGNERLWWQAKGIDPLKEAMDLWEARCGTRIS